MKKRPLSLSKYMKRVFFLCKTHTSRSFSSCDGSLQFSFVRRWSAQPVRTHTPCLVPRDWSHPGTPLSCSSHLLVKYIIERRSPGVISTLPQNQSQKTVSLVVALTAFRKEKQIISATSGGKKGDWAVKSVFLHSYTATRYHWITDHVQLLSPPPLFDH